MFKILACLFLLSVFSSFPAFSASVEALGEAEISGEDWPSARAIAVSRAKWAALEKAGGSEVKIDTIMADAALADEAVKTTLSGVIKSFGVTDEGKDGNVYWVRVKAEIAPNGIKLAINSIAKNTSVAVFIKNISAGGIVTYGGPLQGSIEKELAGKGFEVAGAASASYSDIAVLDKAWVSGNYSDLEDISYKTMSPSILIGTLKSVSLGNDAGYAKIDFSVVSGNLDWKLIGDKDGKKILFASGSAQARGMGATPAAAENALSLNMAKSSTVTVVSEVARKILGENAKTVKVTLKGDINPLYLKELREDIKNIPFVLDVRELSLKDLAVDYPEKTYYLALFLQKKHKYRLSRMDETEIVLERR